MPWLKVDDGFYDHPKLDDVPLEAVGLWLMCATYSARHLTDGFVSSSRVARMGGTEAMTTALVGAGLWVREGDGFRYKDWHEYQPSRAQVEEQRDRKRDQTRERVRKHRAAKGNGGNAHVTRVTALHGNADGNANVETASKTASNDATGHDACNAPCNAECNAQEGHETPENGRFEHENDPSCNARYNSVTPPPGNAPVTPAPTRPDPTIEKLLLTDTASDTKPDLFTEFWGHYPRKVGKQAARKAWAQAIKREHPEAILAATRAMAADPNLPTDKTFIPHPATWLNRDGWEDEPYPAQETKPGDRPTPTPPTFDPDTLRPADAIPMPDNIRQLIKGKTA